MLWSLPARSDVKTRRGVVTQGPSPLRSTQRIFVNVTQPNTLNMIYQKDGRPITYTTNNGILSTTASWHPSKARKILKPWVDVMLSTTWLAGNALQSERTYLKDCLTDALDNFPDCKHLQQSKYNAVNNFSALQATDQVCMYFVLPSH